MDQDSPCVTEEGRAKTLTKIFIPGPGGETPKKPSLPGRTKIEEQFIILYNFTRLSKCVTSSSDKDVKIRLKQAKI